MKPDLSLRASLREATELYETNLLEAETYLEARGIPLTVARDYRLGVVTEPFSAEHRKYLGRLAIPYLTRSGVVTIRFRCIDDHSCKQAKHAKYIGIKHASMPLYNVEALFAHSTELFVTEGELDALVCSSLVGYPAVGCPGANGWRPYFTRCVTDFRRVVVVGDGDDAGREMVAKLEAEIPHATGIVLPDGMDVNSMYLEQGPFVLADYLTAGG